MIENGQDASYIWAMNRRSRMSTLSYNPPPITGRTGPKPGY